MPRPNILLITSDQQHWNTISCRNSEIKTPALDRLAKEGTLFTRAYCPNPTCTPTRSSIITGKHPREHGAWSLGTKLMETQHTVGEDFTAHNYRTALVGKAHFQQLFESGKYTSLESYPIMQDLDFWRNFNEPFYGFEHVELLRNHCDEAHAGQHYAIWMEEKGFDNWQDFFQAPTGSRASKDTRWEIPEELHYNNFISERTNALLEKYNNEDESFFLWASFPDPHPPYLVPDPWHDMYDSANLTVPHVTRGEHENNPEHFQMTQTEKPDFSAWDEDGQSMHGMHSHLSSDEDLAHNMAVYYGMMSYTDHHVGKILDKLDELGLADNTIVVYTTDHGHFFGQHGLIAKGPFMYEDMIKLPFLVRYPNHVPANMESNALQSLVDLAPTFLDFCDIEIPFEMTGKSQKENWLQGSHVRDHIICEHHHEPTTIHVKTYVNKRYKLTVYLNRDYGEVFDLELDPEELNNLWNDPEFQDLKNQLICELLHADMAKESMPMPRVCGA
ncbi:MAG: sulfatase-like hydrolase/transferase [Lentisphaeria bacterium]|nr:sulfatase-like hydrolase/transferase [Lentisphaeria bacterium]NQZ69633.1 sulfatase-like hydrolase/transferase [Lentisphaeria bacterium]